MSKPLPAAAVPYTNSLGHVINPGDDVLIVTTAYKSTNVYMGRYLGYRGEIEDDCGSVVVAVTETRDRLVHKTTRETYDYYKIPGQTYPEYPVRENYMDKPVAVQRDWQPWRHTTLTPQQLAMYEADMEAYRAKSLEYQIEAKKWRDEHESEEYTYERRVTLQRNRIYPVNMPLKDFIKRI